MSIRSQTIERWYCDVVALGPAKKPWRTGSQTSTDDKNPGPHRALPAPRPTPSDAWANHTSQATTAQSLARQPQRVNSSTEPLVLSRRPRSHFQSPTKPIRFAGAPKPERHRSGTRLQAYTTKGQRRAPQGQGLHARRQKNLNRAEKHHTALQSATSTMEDLSVWSCAAFRHLDETRNARMS